MCLLPVLGALADYSDAKKRLMAVFCYTGVTATCLLFFVSGGLYLAGALLFVVANVSFGASNVLYNAFLNDITTADRRDAVSSRGYAMGYLGGGVLLGLNLLLLTYQGALGIPRELAVRLVVALRRPVVGPVSRWSHSRACASDQPGSTRRSRAGESRGRD